MSVSRFIVRFGAALCEVRDSRGGKNEVMVCMYGVNSILMAMWWVS